MNLTAYELALIAGGFGIVGAILGALVTYRLSIRLTQKNHENAIDLMKRQGFNKAAAAFRSTFVDEIFHIRKDAGDIFKWFGVNREEIEIANEKAKILFEPFLPSDQLAGFNAAWEQYKHPEEQYQIKELPTDPAYNKKLGELRLSQINTLLEYAKPQL